MHIDIEKCRKDTGRIQIKVLTAFLFCFLLTRLESAYSLNCGGGGHDIWGQGGGETLALL